MLKTAVIKVDVAPEVKLLSNLWGRFKNSFDDSCFHLISLYNDCYVIYDLVLSDFIISLFNLIIFVIALYYVLYPGFN